MAEQTTTTTPSPHQLPYLVTQMQQAGNLAGMPRQYYPGQGYVNFSAPTEMAMGMGMQRAMAGSPYEPAMGNYLTNTLQQQQFDLSGAGRTAAQMQQGGAAGQAALQQTASGAMLNRNPYLDQMSQAAGDQMTRQFQESVTPGINATFGGGGRTGSGAHQAALGRSQEALGNQLGNMNANIYGNAYGQERSMQMGAANQLQQGALGGIGALGDLYNNVGQSQFRAGTLAPTMQGMEYANIDRLGQVGAQVDEQQRAVLQDAMNRYNYNQNQPYENLNWYSGLVGGSQFGNQQVNQGGGSSVGKVLGGAGTGAGIGAAIGTGIFPGVGTAIGGVLGAIGGGIAGGFA